MINSVVVVTDVEDASTMYFFPSPQEAADFSSVLFEDEVQAMIERNEKPEYVTSYRFFPARVARVSTAGGDVSLERIGAYLPDNYTVLVDQEGQTLIAGYDYAGWTLDGYVIPRLASGLIWAEEVTA